MAELRGCCLPLLVLGALVAAAAGVPLSRDQRATCGYESCPKPKEGMLNVHLVPHSHDDVGWLKTEDQYYYGTNNGHQKATVQYILDSVVEQLQRDPQRRFIQVESAFFYKWWQEQDESQRKIVRTLVENGQLEFVGGAWSMNDEANTNYQSIIDQFTLGLRFLNDTFGPCGRPRVAWQIDPFGHSRGFALLVTQLGFDAVFLNRIDNEDRDNRVKTKTSEMVWNTSPNLGNKADLFASLLFRHYSPPPGFCFDELCGDDAIVDNSRSPEFNLKKKLEDFKNYVQTQAAAYTTDNILLTMGDDFHYSAAGKWYKNLDKLIRHLNEEQASGGKINAFYSTPSCYVKAVNEANQTWTTKKDDFFPYMNSPHSFFTGYYTSRPTQKFMERVGNNILQVAEQLTSTTSTFKRDLRIPEDIFPLKSALGTFQHHDAISGTEKQHVANDYARMLAEGYRNAMYPAEEALAFLTRSGRGAEFKPCLGLNVSQCEITEELLTIERIVVTVYNPLGQKEDAAVRLPVIFGPYRVQDPQGKELTTQLVPIPDAVTRIPGRESKAVHELVFIAEQLPPLGFRSYFVSKILDRQPADDHSTTPVKNAFKIGFENGSAVEIDSETGLLKKITRDGVALDVKQNFHYWTGVDGDSEGTSGAYIFRQKGDAVTIAQKATTAVYKGPLVEEIHQTYTDWLSQVIRTYAHNNQIEMSWQVGPIPTNDGKSKEIISRFETDLKTQKTFYTDANGREVLERKLDFRPTYEVHLAEKVAGNYYPVTSRISIRDADKKQRLSVLPDRSEGGSSLQEGQVELMVHRRLLSPEDLLGGPLNETAFGQGLVVRGTHVVLAGEEAPKNGPTLAAQERLAARRLHLRPWLFFTNASDTTFEKWQKEFVAEFSGLTNPLPTNVHLLSLEQVTEQTLLVRLEHYFDKNDDPELSKPVTINLKTASKPLNILSAQETTLAGNQWLSESSRFTWRTSADKPIVPNGPGGSTSEDPFSVTLNPMDIRTFIVHLAH